MLSTNGVQIPTLHVGQKVSEWRHLFEAAVSLVPKEADRVKMQFMIMSVGHQSSGKQVQI